MREWTPLYQEMPVLRMENNMLVKGTAFLNRKDQWS